jgi:hypothetical protein
MRVPVPTSIQLLPVWTDASLRAVQDTERLQIYEFETLRLLYRVKSASIYIKQLAFGKESLRFPTLEDHNATCGIPRLYFGTMGR